MEGIRIYFLVSPYRILSRIYNIVVDIVNSYFPTRVFIKIGVCFKPRVFKYVSFV
jgi:hypothetical protein